MERRLGAVAIEEPEAYLRRRRDFQTSLFDDTDAEDTRDDLAEADRSALEEHALEQWLPGHGGRVGSRA